MSNSAMSRSIAQSPERKRGARAGHPWLPDGRGSVPNRMRPGSTAQSQNRSRLGAVLRSSAMGYSTSSSASSALAEDSEGWLATGIRYSSSCQRPISISRQRSLQNGNHVVPYTTDFLQVGQGTVSGIPKPLYKCVTSLLWRTLQRAASRFISTSGNVPA